MVSRKLGRTGLIMLFAVLLLAANLRAPLTSVGVLLPKIDAALHLTTFQISIFAILPLLSFSFASYFAVNVSKKLGLNTTILFALSLIIIGVIIRSITNIPSLFIGMLLIGIGIAFGNVLAPVFIKVSFPLHLGIVTALYTVIMNIFGAISSAVAAPLAQSFSYQFSLRAILFITILALISWIYVLKSSKETDIPDVSGTSLNIWKSKLAWHITIFMGGQSVIFYSLINWLPLLLKQEGVDPAITGGYLTILQIAIIIFTFIVPMIAAKHADQVKLCWINGLLYIIAMLGIIFINHNYILIFMIMLGIAAGMSFGLVNTFFSIKVKHSETAKKLSGMAQSVGYLLAAISVMLFGVLHDITGNWTLSLYLLLADALMLLIVGVLAGRNQTID
ncbi:MFS transporter [Macrococcoides canis]|uniref:MFS transporter n=1 Tax=Macrococcoides canis TaxID=1855823 RepID=UPI00165EBB24|nr:MFS transporter [Macrococcus canis]QNR06787.1 MFS transporter [Macrococcus canis]